MANPAKPKRKPVAPNGKPAKVNKQQAISELAPLRVLAERTFVFNPEGVSLREMARQPEFKGVSNETLSRWSREDDWLQKRRDVFDSFRKQVEHSIGQSLVTQAREQLTLYDRMHKQFADFILPDSEGRLAVQPKSAESAAMTLMKIDEARSRIRRELAGLCGDSITPEQRPQLLAPVSDLTEAQSREMAHVLMRHNLDKEAGQIMPRAILGQAPKTELSDDDAQ